VLPICAADVGSRPCGAARITRFSGFCTHARMPIWPRLCASDPPSNTSQAFSSMPGARLHPWICAQDSCMMRWGKCMQRACAVRLMRTRSRQNLKRTRPGAVSSAVCTTGGVQAAHMHVCVHIVACITCIMYVRARDIRGAPGADIQLQQGALRVHARCGDVLAAQSGHEWLPV
jgi:hypothetical protein